MEQCTSDQGYPEPGKVTLMQEYDAGLSRKSSYVAGTLGISQVIPSSQSGHPLWLSGLEAYCISYVFVGGM